MTKMQDESLPKSSSRRSSGSFRLALCLGGIALGAFLLIKGFQISADIAYRDDVARMFGGSRTVELIQDADVVTAQRVQILDKEDMPDPDSDDANPVNYGPIGAAKTLSASQARTLSKLLTSGSSYDWHPSDEDACAPIYGVRLSFHRNEDVIEVWLCFDCDQLLVIETGNDASASRHLNRILSFTLIHDELADIMRDLFPDDPAIQEL